MAKKTRRARKSSRQRKTRTVQTTQHEQAPAKAVAGTFTPAESYGASRTTTAEAAVDFRKEYHYVLTDLKRVGILALAMFALLIGLAFLLPVLGM